MEEYKPLDPRELVVSKQEHTARIEICNSCEHYTKLKFCSLCKCFMPAKAWLGITGCPLKKWPGDK